MPPKSVTVYVSEDGESYTEIGTAKQAENYTVTVEEPVTAKYVRYDVAEGGVWCFISEVEAIFVDQPVAPPVVYEFGDVDGNGACELRDYMMVKRAFLGTFELSADELARADVDGDGKLLAVDYMKVKRYILGTYTPDTQG